MVLVCYSCIYRARSSNSMHTKRFFEYRFRPSLCGKSLRASTCKRPVIVWILWVISDMGLQELRQHAHAAARSCRSGVAAGVQTTEDRICGGPCPALLGLSHVYVSAIYFWHLQNDHLCRWAALGGHSVQLFSPFFYFSTLT